jgi:hypothetical protein
VPFSKQAGAVPQQGKIAFNPDGRVDFFSASYHMKNLTSWLNNRAEDADRFIAQANEAMQGANASLSESHDCPPGCHANSRLGEAQEALNRLHQDAKYATNHHLQQAEAALSNAHEALNNPELTDQVSGYLDQATEALSGVHDDARSAVDCAQTCDTSNYGDDSDCEGGFWECSGSCGWLNVLSCNRDCVMQKVNCFTTAASNYQDCMVSCTSGSTTPAP